MAINAKSKGNRFEIQTCKELSRFLTNNERDDLFWRSSNSGGRQTVRYKKGIATHNQDADITSTHPDGELFVSVISLECKHYKDIGLWSLITRNQGSTLAGWWSVHLEKCSQVNKSPVLVAKQNHRPTLWICNKILSDKIEFECSLEPSLATNNDMHVFLYDDVLKTSMDKFNGILEGLK